ncbi:MAG TPA: endonuclease domain-containing protein [Gammaproteobacteria bacterium]|nr:endonuclease domain-containing protein [Gammaproteobacteria bacterium]
MQTYTQRLQPLARALRKHQTDTEQCLWRHLRRRQIGGVRFYRQRPILDYIVDFYCPAASLVVEVDGSQHFELANTARDQERSRRLKAEGLRVLRFDDRQVLKETPAVMEVIRKVAAERL